jgi:hypothetical protein
MIDHTFDLDTIVRALMLEYIEKRWGNSVNAAASDLVIPQRTLARFVQDGKPGKLELLTKFLRGIEVDPITFLVGYEGLRPHGPTWQEQRYQKVLARFRLMLTADEFERLAEEVERAKACGIFEKLVQIIRGVLELADPRRFRTPPSPPESGQPPRN